MGEYCFTRNVNTHKLTMETLLFWVLGLVGLIIGVVHLRCKIASSEKEIIERQFENLKSRIDELERQKDLTEDENVDIQNTIEEWMKQAKKHPEQEHLRKCVKILCEEIDELPETDSDEEGKNGIKFQWWFVALGFLGLVVILTLFYYIRERIIGHNFVPDVEEV